MSEHLHLTQLSKRIVEQYARGHFLMAGPSGELGWYQSQVHAIFSLESPMPFPRSLGRSLRSKSFEVRVNGDFEGTLAGCAARSETWISEELKEVYRILHRDGVAHSFETWADAELAGGVLGLSLGSAFIGESMFYAVPNASKVALVRCGEYLQFCGFRLFDAQIQNPHLARFGAIEIVRDRYLPLLEDAVQHPAHRPFATAWLTDDYRQIKSHWQND